MGELVYLDDNRPTATLVGIDKVHVISVEDLQDLADGLPSIDDMDEHRDLASALAASTCFSLGVPVRDDR